MSVTCLVAAAPKHLPDDLLWHSNEDDPVYGDPAAVQGGIYRTFINSFPATLRSVGPNSNGAFRKHLTHLQMALTQIHPNTGNPIPSLATHWAFDTDGRTVYYKLEPTACWSDGEPITANDYQYTLQFMRSPHIVSPWHNRHYGDQIVDLKVYDQHTIAITSAIVRPASDLLYYANMAPVPAHFYELSEGWVRRNNWRFAPTPGPYRIESLSKGRRITFVRIHDWWGNNKLYFRHRFNPHKVVFKVIRSADVAYQYFLEKELDSYPLMSPRYWYSKSNVPEVDAGAIKKLWFYNQRPRSSFGFYLNSQADILASREVRLGIHHALNMDLVLKTVLHNDYSRLRSSIDGHGRYSNHKLSTRRFNLELANHYFSQAGWSARNEDGVRTRAGRTLELEVQYSDMEHTAWLSVLQQEALKAGVNLVLRLAEPTSAFSMAREKRHAITLSGFRPSYRPQFWSTYHGDNAGDAPSNNFCNCDDEELNHLIDRYRKETSESAREDLSRRIAHRIYDLAVFIPAFTTDYTRVAYWHWLRLPPHHGTRTSTNLFDPFGPEGGLFWIDHGVRQQSVKQKASTDNGTNPNRETIDQRWRVASG